MSFNDEVKEEHESFGMIAAHRTNGGHGNLFGSSITHYNTIRILIKRADKRRHLNSDWFHGKEELIEVELSPSQFADFITSMNMGDGVPCTLRRVAGKRMENCPESNQRQEFEKEFKYKVKGATDQMSKIVADANEILDQKTLKKSDRETLKDMLNRLMMEVRSNMPFIQSQFNEAMDKTVREAKGEVEAFVAQRLNSLGQSALENLGASGMLESTSENLSLPAPE